MISLVVWFRLVHMLMDIVTVAVAGIEAEVLVQAVAVVHRMLMDIAELLAVDLMMMVLRNMVTVLSFHHMVRLDWNRLDLCLGRLEYQRYP